MHLPLRSLFLVLGLGLALAQPPPMFDYTGVTCPTDGDFEAISEEVADEYREITADGCPDHDWSGQTVPNDPVYMDWVVQFSANPTFAEESIPVGTSSPVLGAIGIALDGVAYYSPVDANGDDAIETEGETLDECYGHTDFSGSFHYHYNPTCVSNDDDTLDDDEHSPLVGYIADGFPIYGFYESYPDTPEDLDGCNGHYADDLGYHYHLTTEYPYTIDCFRGCPVADESFNANLVDLAASCVATTWNGNPETQPDDWVDNAELTETEPTISAASNLASSVFSVVAGLFASLWLSA